MVYEASRTEDEGEEVLEKIYFCNAKAGDCNYDISGWLLCNNAMMPVLRSKVNFAKPIQIAVTGISEINAGGCWL